jgi:hypothetical protein
VDDSRTELDRLSEELRAIEAEFWEKYDSVASTWQFAMGPLRIRGVFNSVVISLVYFVFNTICFVGGIVLILVGRSYEPLGISLVVGALFSFGAFVAQMWTLAVQAEREVAVRVFGQAETVTLRRLGKRRAELIDRIARIRSPDSHLDSDTD